MTSLGEVNARAARPEFPYLDGIRGIAALMVVFYHAYLFTGYTGAAVAAMPIWGHIVGLGYLGVPIFIVLSGYVLMLPVVNSPDYRFRNGTWTFLKRRARRILPPYYAALLVTLILIWTIPLLQSHGGTQWDTKIPVTIPGIVSHVFLVHDFSSGWIGQINGPMWSVAVEFQIYFVMPFILLPLWRRIQPVWIVVVALIVTLIPTFIGKGSFIHPWFIALFAVGMWAAQLTLRPEPVKLVRTITLVALVLIPISLPAAKLLHTSSGGLTEVFVGISLAGALIWVGRRGIAGNPAPVVKPFASRPLMFLGLISYSVYLFHSPLLGLANLLMLPLGLPVVFEYLIMTFVMVPAALVVCWGFFLLVERHFLNTRQRHAAVELTHDEQKHANSPTQTSPINP